MSPSRSRRLVSVAFACLAGVLTQSSDGYASGGVPLQDSQYLSTARYDFRVVGQTVEEGPFQVALDHRSHLWFINRFDGTLYNLPMGTYMQGASPGTSRLLTARFHGNLFTSLGIDRRDSNVPVVMDLHISGETAFASLVHWPTTKLADRNDCYQFLVVAFPLGVVGKKTVQRLFTTPCMRNVSGGGANYGGRITDNDRFLYVSIGDVRYDRSGYPNEDPDSVREQASPHSVFGSVVRVDLSSSPRTWTVISRGHRNPQGLTTDGKRLYLTEHGAQGGDELNSIVEGRNYGWPFRHFGKPYPVDEDVIGTALDSSRNPSRGVDRDLEEFGARSGSHSGVFPPVMSWTPALGVGNVKIISDRSTLVDWRRNLIVAGMKQMSIHRLILHGDRVIHDETIYIGNRIRDFEVTNFGWLIMATDDGALLVLMPTG